MVMEERFTKILDILKEKKFVEVTELAKMMGISVETVRRDLKQLEIWHQLKRVRGGAASVDSAEFQENPTWKKMTLCGERKVKGMNWHAVNRGSFRLYGFPFYDHEGVYRRYSLNPPEPLPEKVEGLAWHTSGGQVRFRAYISKLRIRVKLSSSYTPFYNTTPIAAGGFDLYLSDGDGKFTFYRVSRFDAEALPDCYEYQLLDLEERQLLECIIHFPIGVGVENVLLGMDEDAIPTRHTPFASDRRILLYGGSITQGYCASRPGMTVSNILSRWLNQEVVNFGLNGSALCEDSVAKAVAMVDAVEWLIINTEGNCPSTEWIGEHLPRFLRIYREANPDTKIAVMSFMRESRERFDKTYHETRLAKKECQRQIVERFRAEGDDRIFFWDGEEFTSPEEDIFFENWSAGEECTVDTQHKSDLGFWLMAKGIYRRLKNG